jgi:uncharacterized membrane protein
MPDETGINGLRSYGRDCNRRVRTDCGTVITVIGQVDRPPDLRRIFAAHARGARATVQIPMKSASCSDAMSAMHSDFKPAMIPI